MLSVNLLPSVEKEALRLEETRRTVIFFAALALAVLTIGLVLLLPSFLTGYFAERELLRLLESESRTSRLQRAPEIFGAEDSIREAIAEIRQYASAPPRSSTLLQRLLAAEPGITVSSLTVRKSGEVALGGIAETRSALLAFEEALRKSDQFHEISFPLSNIIRERDIRFTVQGKLKSNFGL